MRTILHIETSELFKNILRKFLSEKGFSYVGVKCIKEARDTLASRKIDFIITSLTLEEESGEEFIAELSSNDYKNIPIFVLTGNENIGEKRKMFELGVVDYMSKSTSPDEIAEHIIKYVKKEEEFEELRKLKIFVLDDSKLVIDFMEKILKRYGIENVTYCTEQGDILEQEIFDCYIIDLVLKEKSGRHLISKIRKKNKKAVILIISGVDNNKTISNVLQEGADDYIIKPFTPEIIIAKIRTNIRSYILLKELEKKNQLLAHMVITDGLTGLYNHKYMFERVEMEISEVKRYEKIFSLIMLDVDFFKKVNDTYGHQVGDTVLMEVAHVLKKGLRDVDILGRYGGEEFMIILPEIGDKQAVKAAERLRKDIENMEWEFKDMKVTISLGVVTYSGETAEEIVGKADALLYKAKHKGRNRVEHNHQIEAVR